MHCRDCDYSLWNLTAGQCPECGLPFTPADYEFVPNCVRFCCPHCNQAYYGTSPKGHLEPAEFDCAKCGKRVHMNEMVLLPAEGVRDEQTRPGSNPWLERERIGFARAWWRTLTGAMVRPGAIARGTPVGSSLGQAWWFLISTIGVVVIISFIPALCMVAVMPYFMSSMGGVPAGGPGPGMMAGLMAVGTGVSMIFVLPVMLLFVLLWGLATHGMLRVTGGCGPLRQTYQAVCYSSGTYVTSLIPCAGGYAGPIWWLVSAILMVRQLHGVSGVRGTFAVITFPVGIVVLLVVSYIGLVAAMLFAAAGAGGGAGQLGMTPSREVAIVGDALVAYADEHGSWPGHGVELVVSGHLGTSDLLSVDTTTIATQVPVADGDLFRFSLMLPDDQAAAARAAAAALPPRPVAHRVGDYVFTYHGVDLDTADPGVWLVVFFPDPDANRPPVRGAVLYFRADGVTGSCPYGELPEKLAQQNALRGASGLPPLPDPARVTHDAPAR